MSASRFRLILLAALVALVAASACEARGGGGGGGGGGGQRGQKKAVGGGRAIPAGKLHAPAREYDIAVLPPTGGQELPDPLAGVSGLIKVLEKLNLRVAPARAAQQAYRELGDADAHALAERIGCRYLLRTTINGEHAERSLGGGSGGGGGSGLMSAGKLLLGGVALFHNIHFTVWTGVAVVGAGVLVAGVSLDAQVDVTCEVVDGNDGHSVWTGSAGAAKSRRMFALFGSAAPLLRQALSAALKAAVTSPRAPPRSIADPWANSMLLSGEQKLDSGRDPWDNYQILNPGAHTGPPAGGAPVTTTGY